HLLPDVDPLAHRADRRQRLNLELNVDLPAAQVVDDGDLVTTIRQVQRRRPATEPITAENHNAHYDSHHAAPSSESPRPLPPGTQVPPGGWRRAGHGVRWRSVYPRETVTTPTVTRPELDITASHLVTQPSRTGRPRSGADTNSQQADANCPDFLPFPYIVLPCQLRSRFA